MYKKYCRKLIKPLLLENGYYPSTPRSVVSYEKKTSTGIKIVIDVQKNKWEQSITVNITILKEDNINKLEIFEEIDHYRLGHFSDYPFQDLWWSIEEYKIEKSFLEIVNIMQSGLFQNLEQFEDKQFVGRFIENINIIHSL